MASPIETVTSGVVGVHVAGDGAADIFAERQRAGARQRVADHDEFLAAVAEHVVARRHAP